jgi:hypothetical protein
MRPLRSNPLSRVAQTMMICERPPAQPTQLSAATSQRSDLTAGPRSFTASDRPQTWVKRAQPPDMGGRADHAHP